MPHYDYECQDCGHTFEVFQSMSEAKLTECPRCGGSLQRKIGAGAGMIFKGSGFYTTDYRSSNYKKQQRAETSSTTGSGDSDAKGSPQASGHGSPGGGGGATPPGAGGGPTPPSAPASPPSKSSPTPPTTGHAKPSGASPGKTGD